MLTPLLAILLISLAGETRREEVQGSTTPFEWQIPNDK